MKMDFRGVDLTSHESKWTDGCLLRQVDAEFHIHFGARRGVLEFSATVGDQQVGNTSVTFDGQDGAGAAAGPGNNSYTPSCATQ